jgi:hypothetical protein
MGYCHDHHEILLAQGSINITEMDMALISLKLSRMANRGCPLDRGWTVGVIPFAFGTIVAATLIRMA